MTRSYSREWYEAGMLDLLETLIGMKYSGYTVADFMEIAEFYDIDEALIKRLAWDEQ